MLHFKFDTVNLIRSANPHNAFHFRMTGRKGKNGRKNGKADKETEDGKVAKRDGIGNGTPPKKRAKITDQEVEEGSPVAMGSYAAENSDTDNEQQVTVTKEWLTAWKKAEFARLKQKLRVVANRKARQHGALRKYGVTRARKKSQANTDETKPVTRTGGRTIMEKLRGWVWPSFKDETAIHQQRIKWPVWRSAMMRALDSAKPDTGEWSQADKFNVLSTFAGDRVTRMAMSIKPDDEHRKFDALMEACDSAFAPLNPMIEAGRLREMYQGTEQSLSDFINEYTQQIELCGFGTAQKETEMTWLLRRNTVNAELIESQTFGMSYVETEMRALNLEEIRIRKKNGKGGRPMAEVLAVSWAPKSEPDKRSGDRGRERVGNSREGRAENRTPGRNDCGTCGRFCGHSDGFTCPAKRNRCNACNEVGHFGRVCPKPKVSEGSGKVGNSSKNDDDWQ